MTDRLPGIIFRFRGSEQIKGVTGKRFVKVTLDAEIHDDEVWNSVQPKLQELKVYTADDFQGELLEVLRKDNLELERKLKDLEAAHQSVVTENTQMKMALAVLHHELEPVTK